MGKSVSIVYLYRHELVQILCFIFLIGLSPYNQAVYLSLVRTHEHMNCFQKLSIQGKKIPSWQRNAIQYLLWIMAFVRAKKFQSDLRVPGTQKEIISLKRQARSHINCKSRKKNILLKYNLHMRKMPF